jgi:uncharacterized protein YabE (DUF348 family)
MKVFGVRVTILTVAALLLVVIFVATMQPVSADGERRLVTFYDDGVQTTILTSASTLADALAQADIAVEPADHVEPAVDTELIASHYTVNIYRARPVLVIDGDRETKIITAAQSGRTMAEDAGVQLATEDLALVGQTDDILADGGVGLKVIVQRAIEVNLVLYGREQKVLTQAATVADFIAEKGLQIDDTDYLNLGLGSHLYYGMTLRIWREGKNTVTVEEEVPFDTDTIQDADRPIGYKAVRVPGTVGQKLVTYEVEMHGGVETAPRRIIQTVTIVEPVRQIEVVGIKMPSSTVRPLTASMGRNRYMTADGILRQETYYDLNMSRVMKNCGQGGYYTVRADGVKVDRAGLVIVAANLNRYPRCSQVSTSLGRGKVYDTGGFAATNPEQFDIATDWSRRDGI